MRALHIKSTSSPFPPDLANDHVVVAFETVAFMKRKL
jgi:hypothetical protein